MGTSLLVTCTARPTEANDALPHRFRPQIDPQGVSHADSHTLSNGSEDVVLSEFTKRQCVWNKDLQDWQCDAKMPTLIQLITRMREGKGTADRSVAFYTHLGDPALQPNKDNHEAWLCAWFKGNEERGLVLLVGCGTRQFL
jgi:hypothetical protein